MPHFTFYPNNFFSNFFFYGIDWLLGSGLLGPFPYFFVSLDSFPLQRKITKGKRKEGKGSLGNGSYGMVLGGAVFVRRSGMGRM